MNRAAPWSAAALAVVLVVTVQAAAQQATPVCGYEVVNEYPHDDQAYTQGLVYRNGELFESTGLRGSSSLRRVDLETGLIEQIHFLDDTYFGEGITMVNDRLIQLTWTLHAAFVYDRTTFDVLGQFTYTGEGWGLTDGAGRLIMSNGSSTLRFRNPDTFEVIGEIVVRDGISPVSSLNELEFIHGEILANRYQTNLIARIRPDSGQVIAWIDLTGLLDPVPPGAGVLNGIAFDEATERLFVTGKKWPTLFEIELTGCQPLPLFADDFASGNTLGWSTVTP
ncbi:MAG: glutaminyl-peptide cyclotransferase [Thermoanaerobaculales bacterium]|nr:glutaminyl-peptide cyclotransferase [Thermoanaerobaculales bacterium]